MKIGIELLNALTEAKKAIREHTGAKGLLGELNDSRHLFWKIVESDGGYQEKELHIEADSGCELVHRVIGVYEGRELTLVVIMFDNESRESLVLLNAKKAKTP